MVPAAHRLLAPRAIEMRGASGDDGKPFVLDSDRAGPEFFQRHASWQPLLRGRLCLSLFSGPLQPLIYLCSDHRTPSAPFEYDRFTGSVVVEIFYRPYGSISYSAGWLAYEFFLVYGDGNGL